MSLEGDLVVGPRWVIGVLTLLSVLRKRSRGLPWVERDRLQRVWMAMEAEHHLVRKTSDFLAMLRVLTPAQILEIDRALEAIGPFGEVRLVKVKGKVRFIQQMESRDLLDGGQMEGGGKRRR